VDDRSTGALLSEFDIKVWADPSGTDEAQFAYWNDQAVERSKPWNVVSPATGFVSQERYLESSGLLELLIAALKVARADRSSLGRTGVDVACGTAWAVPYLLDDPDIQRIYCVEYSRHRLFELAPAVLRHYGVRPDRVSLCLGSFYDLRLADGSLDFAFLSQAFHHADDPRRLLHELRRVLRPDGLIIIIGEHVVPPLTVLYSRHAARWLFSRVIPARVQLAVRGHPIGRPPLLRASVSDLLAPNPLTGDHYYQQPEYKRLFAEAGFRAVRVKPPNVPMQGFVLRPNPTAQPPDVSTSR
jgi:SAM-dependent methyltransferase